MEEMEKTFSQGKQVWGQPGNVEAKRSMVYEAFRRAELRFRLAVSERRAFCGAGGG